MTLYKLRFSFDVDEFRFGLMVLPTDSQKEGYQNFLIRPIWPNRTIQESSMVAQPPAVE
ncbi:hypothetical protein TanjilG_26964 [Lupinus angustifolius]|uniref:Uncharacterized protein n=1 Tax=Lupinus angustifolius TaxID=3871 RepID=A0A1J7FMI9_LUPAN|nr:hypothetical protein TanjilG_26964 [Lupinus angustifolius]